jgi:5-(carboxyamino)imidazole ribonucleotide synthase
MGNLLGALWRDGAPPRTLTGARRHAPEGLREVVLYGKTEARPRRKMGHFSVQAGTPDAALARARRLREAWELDRP